MFRNYLDTPTHTINLFATHTSLVWRIYSPKNCILLLHEAALGPIMMWPECNTDLLTPLLGIYKSHGSIRRPLSTAKSYGATQSLLNRVQEK